MYTARAYAATSATSPLAPTTIRRRDPTPSDVQIEILYCGICHSDLHMVRSEWKGFPATYPCVPGHEIVGRVTRVGPAVGKFAVGDVAAVGCLVDSDGSCSECLAGLEQFCPNQTQTYGGRDRHLGGPTYGGYSESIVVDERSRCAYRRISTSPALPRWSARASRPGRRCAITASGRASASASSGSAGSGTWR